MFNRPLSSMTEADIESEITFNEQCFGHDFAHGAERLLAPGHVIYNFEGKPATITRVAGRRFIWATTDAYPEPHLINWRYYTENPNFFDESATLADLVERHHKFGRR